jgi:hypothetical protein
MPRFTGEVQRPVRAVRLTKLTLVCTGIRLMVCSHALGAQTALANGIGVTRGRFTQLYFSRTIRKGEADKAPMSSVPSRPTDPLLLAAARHGARNSR